MEFPPLTPETDAEIARHLEPGLHPENPLDAFGTMHDLVDRYGHMITALTNDPNIAIGYFMSDPRDGYVYAEAYTDAVLQAAGRTDKLLAMVTNFSMTDERNLALKLKTADVPLLRGTKNALLAAQHVMAYRDFRARQDAAQEMPGPAKHWRGELARKGRLSEHDGLQMLAAFGIASPGQAQVESTGDLPAALGTLSFPIVLKTAENYAHKSDVGGVILNIANADEATTAYTAMAAKLGPKALCMEMIPNGTELALGAIWDDSFGPVVIVSAGGVLIELLQDRAAALAPFGADEAKRLLQSLRSYALLQGARGMPAADIDDIAAQIARFSTMVAALGDACAEIDINPLICSERGAVAVDCLAVGALSGAGAADG